ncbi:Peroxiredoxin [Methylophilaceae bacterium 11]|nr:Peroxiredoxin [Methylophilaceae bacterium 11]
MPQFQTLPANLPAPVDDGACRHLLHATLPDVALASTQGPAVNLYKLTGWSVIYVYPMTGQPDIALPDGWDSIPGARGCTPQSCGFRDHYAELQQLGTHVFGLSTQTNTYQTEAATRLHLPFALLSDHQFVFAEALQLPTFEVDQMRLTKRVTLLVLNGRIEHYIYPVFPPDQNATQVMDWLTRHV